MRAASVARTVRTRCLHFLHFCYTMKWTDNLLLEGDGEELAVRGQYQLAMYAIHLSTGHSIYCRQIKLATIEDYVGAAADLLEQFSGIDYRKDDPKDSMMGNILGPVYKDIKRYEGVPNRREPYDLAMHLRGRQVAQGTSTQGLVHALVDGFEQGLCCGHRLSEWAQPAGVQRVDRPNLNHLVDADVRTRALVPDDFRFELVSRARVKGLQVLLYPLEEVHKCWVRYRTQKNGEHGAEKLHTRNTNPGGICMVASTYRSMQRFRTLQTIDGRLSAARTPLSVYLHEATGSVRLITATEIEGFMRRLAAEVYHLHPGKDAKDLQRWSSHSIRVGACVVLHAMGFSDTDIQWILRWRSLAFTAYLRNIAILATRQHRALDRAAAAPHLIY